MTDASQAAAAWIRAHYPADTLVAVNHAGALPYYLDWPCLDMVGLANIHIARDITGGLHHKFDPAYVVSSDPGVVVLNTVVAPGTDGVFYHPGYWEGETALVSYEPFQRRYRPVPTFWTWQSATGATSYIVLFERVVP